MKTVLLILIATVAAPASEALQLTELQQAIAWCFVDLPVVSYTDCVDRSVEAAKSQTVVYTVRFELDSSLGSLIATSIDSVSSAPGETGSLCGDYKGYDFRLTTSRKARAPREYSLKFGCGEFGKADVYVEDRFVGHVWVNSKGERYIKQAYARWHKRYFGWLPEEDCGPRLRKRK